MKLLSLALVLLALTSFSAAAEDPARRIPVEEYLKKTIIPKVDLRDATIPEALEYLRKAAQAADPDGNSLNIIYKAPVRRAKLPPPGLAPVGGVPGLEIPAVPGIPTPNAKGVPGLDAPPPVPSVPKARPPRSAVLIPGLDGPGAGKEGDLPAGLPPGAVEGETRLTLRLHDVPLGEALKYVATLTNHAVRWDAYAIVITDVGEDGKPLPKPEIRYEPAAAREVIAKRLSEIIIPKIDFKKATIREALDFLGRRVQALDPDGAGLNMVLKLDDAGGPDAKPRPGPITLALKNVPLTELLCYIAELGELQVIVENGVVYIGPKERK